jgi:hypothetical protein
MSVVILDRDDTRTLEHYDVCDEDSASDLKRARGVIRDEAQVICQSFGFTAEYDVSSPKWKELVRECVQNCTIFRSEEGTLLRLYFHGDNVAPVDAQAARRLCEPLVVGSLVRRAVPPGADALLPPRRRRRGARGRRRRRRSTTASAPRSIGVRLLLPPAHERRHENRLRPSFHADGILCRPVLPRPALRGQPDAGALPAPPRRFSSPEGLEEYVRSLDPLKHQGVIVFLPDQTVFKVVHPEYSAYASLRGSEPSLFRAYLRIRQSDENLHRFLTVFPERRGQVLGYEDQILSLGKLIQRYYVRRFIRKEQLMVNKNYFYVMRLAHRWHCSNRDANIVTLQKILELLDEQQPHFLYTLLTVRE